ncbi:MAG: hypothetical protein GEV07_04975 [Streptosporangiales bacterium]|nr:hypothetical protein [Streptosporangiales bacterium]
MTVMTVQDTVTIGELQAYPPDAIVQIVEGTIYLSRAGGFDVADLDELPDDRRRHELVDGVVVLSPAPRRIHQRGLLELASALRAAAPAHLEVVVAPFDVDAGPRSQVEPDILVLPATTATVRFRRRCSPSRCCHRRTAATTW